MIFETQELLFIIKNNSQVEITKFVRICGTLIIKSVWSSFTEIPKHQYTDILTCTLSSSHPK